MNSIAGRHLESIDRNEDGGILVLSSNLTGQFWDGGINYYPGDSDELEGDKIYKTHVAKEMYVGVCDGGWCDSTHAVVGTDEGEVHVLTLEDKFFVEPIEIIQHHSYVTSVSTNSTRCVSGGADCYVNIGDIEEAKLLTKYKAHSEAVNQVVTHNASPDMFASCSMDKSVLLWDTRNSKPAKRISLSQDIVSAIGYHDNILVLGTERGQLLIKDLRRADHPLKSVINHCRSVRRIKFCPNRPELIASCAEDGVVNIVNYNLINTSTIYSSEIHTDFVTGLVWTDPQTLLSCSWDSTIRRHNINSVQQADDQQTHSSDNMTELNGH